jgi:5-methyltetrahydrofolate--homocysteine methyltransferase
MDSARRLRILLEERIAFLDGAMGTMLMARGMPPGVPTEIWAYGNPGHVQDVHRAYIEAGSDIILACTFGGSAFHLGRDTGRINSFLAETALRAADGKAIAAASIGPSGRLISPVGDASWKDVYNAFLIQARAIVEAGIDAFFLETFTDPRQLKAAVLAVRDACPQGYISAHLTFASGERTGAGTSPEALAVLCEQLPVDGVGANCSTGPEALLPVVKTLAARSSLQVTVEPNAGLPDGSGNYSMPPDLFASAGEEMAWAGASIIGGCCGTTPEHIRALRAAVGERTQESVVKNPLMAFTSVDRIVPLGAGTLLVGESVNPTGRKALKRAIREGDHHSVISMARDQDKADLLDINMGIERLMPDGLLQRVFSGLCTGAPLSVDLSDPCNIEAAFSEMGGIGLLNSLLSTGEHIAARVGTLLRHGGYAVLLPIGEEGLPDTPEGRLAVLLRGASILREHGFPPSRILADPIVKTIAAGADPEITVKTLRLFFSSGYMTIAGVSNVSHGLPQRSGINGAFLARLSALGLDAAIVNVNDPFTLPLRNGAAILTGRMEPTDFEIPEMPDMDKTDDFSSLQLFLLRGDGKTAEGTAAKLIQEGFGADEVVSRGLAPAMDRLGALYSRREIFLPHLIAGAEAARTLMDYLGPLLRSKTGETPGRIVLATVEGDMHDIGKNLVGLFLSNAGFEVIDLGRDIPSWKIVDSALKNSADLIGLSALMSTTAVKMAEVVDLLRERGSAIPVIAGGAVVTEEFASSIGAIHGKDAYSAVEIARKLINS